MLTLFLLQNCGLFYFSKLKRTVKDVVLGAWQQNTFQEDEDIYQN